MNWLSDFVCWIGCQTHTCFALDLLQPALQNRIGAWVIIALLSVVWGTMGIAAWYVWRIAHATGSDE